MKITGNPKLVVRSLRLSEHLAQTIDQAATRLRLDQATATRLAIEIGLADLESIDYDLAGAILNYRVAHHQAKAADDPCIWVVPETGAQNRPWTPVWLPSATGQATTRHRVRVAAPLAIPVGWPRPAR